MCFLECAGIVMNMAQQACLIAVAITEEEKGAEKLKEKAAAARKAQALHPFTSVNRSNNSGTASATASTVITSLGTTNSPKGSRRGYSSAAQTPVQDLLSQPNADNPRHRKSSKQQSHGSRSNSAAVVSETDSGRPVPDANISRSPVASTSSTPVASAHAPTTATSPTLSAVSNQNVPNDSDKTSQLRPSDTAHASNSNRDTPTQNGLALSNNHQPVITVDAGQDTENQQDRLLQDEDEHEIQVKDRNGLAIQLANQKNKGQCNENCHDENDTSICSTWERDWEIWASSDYDQTLKQLCSALIGRRRWLDGR